MQGHEYNDRKYLRDLKRNWNPLEKPERLDPMAARAQERNAAYEGERPSLSAAEAVVRRTGCDRPNCTGWKSWRLVLYRFEPGLDALGEMGLDAQRIWTRATGLESARPDYITASGMMAIADLASVAVEDESFRLAADLPTHRRLEWRVPDPAWQNGRRTSYGVALDRLLRGQRVIDWWAVLDREFHRRYFE